MLNIIIYESDDKFMHDIADAVNVALANCDIEYHIYKYGKCNNEFNELVNNRSISKIYIIDVDCLTGIELASRIRDNDFDSIIIFTSECNKYQNDVFSNRLMVLDFIFKNNNCKCRLIKDIITSLKIIYRDKTFVFSYNHVIYRIPYSHINYIEKEPSIKRCIIHTLDKDFYVANSIEKIKDSLNICFFKTHQACIVNVNNIKKIDFSSNIIVFNNGDITTLLSEKMKRNVKKALGVYK